MRFSILILLSALSLFSPVTSLANQSAFNHSEKNYRFNLTIKSSLSVENLLELLYDFKHVNAYSSDASKQKMLRDSVNSYEIEMSIKYLIYSSRSIYKRTLLPESGLVKIEMRSFNQTNKLFPRIIDYQARYDVKSEMEYSTIEYVQMVSFDKSVNWFYLKILKDKLDEFAEKLELYIKNEEKKRAL